jgi:hypothetical protein
MESIGPTQGSQAKFYSSLLALQGAIEALLKKDDTGASTLDRLQSAIEHKSDREDVALEVIAREFAVTDAMGAVVDAGIEAGFAALNLLGASYVPLLAQFILLKEGRNFGRRGSQPAEPYARRDASQQ